MILYPSVAFADEYPGYRAPSVEISGDAEGPRFRQQAELSVPNLLYLLEHPGKEGAFTHLAVDVMSTYFAAHHDREYEVALRIDGAAFDTRLFHKWYHRHQFLIPLPSFRRDRLRITLTAEATTQDRSTGEAPVFELSLLLVSKQRIWARCEQMAIWVFSTARSGSTWLVVDILCADGRARPVDEPGTGRMFAPLQWDAERFYETGNRELYIESGFPFETGEKPRHPDLLPVFERAFGVLNKENQILSRHNFAFYHQALRDVAIGHVLNEWGILGYSRLVYKMPNDSHCADFIMRAFPQSHMVFMMRDGRDVMRSRFSPFASPDLANASDKQLRRYAIFFYSHFWNFQVDIIAAAFEAHPHERRILVKYEDLRAHPDHYIAKIYDHLGMSATDEEIAGLADRTRLENLPASERGPEKPRQSGLVGGFHSVFDEEEIALMNAIMGQNLLRYGYEL